MNEEEIIKKLEEASRLIREAYNIQRKKAPYTDKYYALIDLLAQIDEAKALYEEELEELEEEEETF